MSTPSVEGSSNKWKGRFFTIWTGQAFSLFGSNLVGFALIWWLTKTPGSATVLATASLAGLLPQVLLGPLAGTLVDPWNRRIIMIVADSIITLATLVLAVLFALGWVEIWHVYLLLFVRSLAGGFHWPAMQASTSLMVPNEHLARIQGLNQILMGALNIISAPLGALLIEVLPLQGVLAIDDGRSHAGGGTLVLLHYPASSRRSLSSATREMVLEYHLADPTNVSHDQAFLIADNQVMMAFPATDLLSTLKILQPGDAVDILVSIPQSVQPQEPGLGEQTLAGEEEVGEETRLFTFDSIQAVNIQAVVIDINEENQGRTSTSGAVNTSPSAVPTPSPSEYNIKAYLLALSPQDALILKHLRDAGGNFDLVLRSPTSNHLFDISPVFSEYVIEKYNLEIEK